MGVVQFWGRLAARR